MSEQQQRHEVEQNAQTRRWRIFDRTRDEVYSREFDVEAEAQEQCDCLNLWRRIEEISAVLVVRGKRGPLRRAADELIRGMSEPPQTPVAENDD